MKINTIGFTKKNAQTFFNFIKHESVSTLIDVRLNNVSQLAAYAKRDDLKFFLRELCGSDYVHIPDLAPTKELLHNYKKGYISWEHYQESFLNLMARRNIERILKPSLLKDSCLLCSEHEPHFCHRRLVTEYLNAHSDFNFTVKHLY